MGVQKTVGMMDMILYDGQIIGQYLCAHMFIFSLINDYSPYSVQLLQPKIYDGILC